MIRLVIVLLGVLPGFCADWNPKLAADYLDSRQKEWFAWKAAANAGGPCVSCHTGLSYLLARPALRGLLNEQSATAYETGLKSGLIARVERKGKSDGIGVEAVLSALVLGPESQKAFERLWALQLTEGPGKGAWPWYNLDLDPWEMPQSRYYGATLAALAVGNTTPSYRENTDVREHVAALVSFLRNEMATQPLHSRLMLLWASTKLPEVLPSEARQQIVDEVWSKQQPDGSWTMESLGPFGAHPEAPASSGSNSYATALAAFVLEEAGLPMSDRRIVKATDWLKAHQDAQTGSWPAESMNHKYDVGSMESRFMRDAATGFAVLALTGAQSRSEPPPMTSR
jgi:squalene-hopene/tetraprenyl-beta-curcumene cyclase